MTEIEQDQPYTDTRYFPSPPQPVSVQLGPVDHNDKDTWFIKGDLLPPDAVEELGRNVELDINYTKSMFTRWNPYPEDLEEVEKTPIAEFATLSLADLPKPTGDQAPVSPPPSAEQPPLPRSPSTEPPSPRPASAQLPTAKPPSAQLPTLQPPSSQPPSPQSSTLCTYEHVADKIREGKSGKQYRILMGSGRKDCHAGRAHRPAGRVVAGYPVFTPEVTAATGLFSKPRRSEYPEEVRGLWGVHDGYCTLDGAPVKLDGEELAALDQSVCDDMKVAIQNWLKLHGEKRGWQPNAQKKSRKTAGAAL